MITIIDENGNHLVVYVVIDRVGNGNRLSQSDAPGNKLDIYKKTGGNSWIPTRLYSICISLLY